MNGNSTCESCGVRLLGYVFLLGASLALAGGCSSSKKAATQSPLEVCRADPSSKCCANSDCGANQVCDFSYICSPTPSGVSCSSGSGTRVCLDRCTNSSCDAPKSCTTLEQFAGGDAGEVFDVCK